MIQRLLSAKYIFLLWIQTSYSQSNPNIFSPCNSSLSYCFYDTQMFGNYDKALSICNELESTLPIIIDEQTNIAFKQYLDSAAVNYNVWLQAKQEDSATYRWIEDNAENVHFNLNQGFFSNTTGSHGLLSINSNGTVIVYAEKPIYSANYACVKNSPFQEISASQYGTVTDGNVHLLISAGASFQSWYGAKHICITRGADLAGRSSVEVLRTYLNILSQKPPSQYWIGLTNRRWSWGQMEMLYTDWNDLEPSNIQQKCVVAKFASNRKWADFDCSSQLPRIICMKEKMKVTSTEKTDLTNDSLGSTLSPSNNSVDKPNKTNIPIIAGASAGVFILVLIVIILIVVIVKPSCLKRQSGQKSSTTKSAASNGITGHVTVVNGKTQNGHEKKKKHIKDRAKDVESQKYSTHQEDGDNSAQVIVYAEAQQTGHTSKKGAKTNDPRTTVYAGVKQGNSARSNTKQKTNADQPKGVIYSSLANNPNTSDMSDNDKGTKSQAKAFEIDGDGYALVGER